jgi:hypothetical protein
MAIEEVLRELLTSGYTSGARGCSERQIQQLEKRYGHPMPAAYRKFLQVMGQAAGVLFDGTDILWPQPLELTDAAREWLAEDNDQWQLSEDAFVFLMHQGYVLVFFRFGQGDDPPVYRYMEGDDAPECRGSFSEYLAGWLEDTRMPKR